MRLLLAEDEKSLSRAVKAILEAGKYSVDAVFDGEEALDYLETDTYDGVILDIMMPKKDGITVLKELRNKGFGNVSLNRASLVLSTKTGEFKLSNKEFQMMELLMSYPKNLISAEKFMEKIWGFDTEADISVVWVYISYLRKKLTSLKADIEIKVTRNLGYSLNMAK